MSIATAQRPSAPARPRPAVATPGWNVAGRCTYRNGVHELHLNEAPPGGSLAALNRTAEFALIDEDDLLLICYRFGESAPWSVADYRWSDGRGIDLGEIPPIGGLAERRGLLSVTLPEAKSGGTIRFNFTLSLDFTRALNAAIRDRAGRPFHLAEQAHTIHAMAARWPSLQALATRAGVRSMGHP